MDQNGSSSPYARLHIGKQKFRTNVVKKDLNPSWCEEFRFQIDDMNEKLRIVVMDEDKYFNNDFMGKLKVPLGKVFEREDKSLGTAWYTLKSKKMRSKNSYYGEILLTVVISQSYPFLDDMNSYNGDYAPNMVISIDSSPVSLDNLLKSSETGPLRLTDATGAEEKSSPPTLTARLAQVFMKNGEAVSANAKSIVFPELASPTNTSGLPLPGLLSPPRPLLASPDLPSKTKIVIFDGNAYEVEDESSDCNFSEAMKTMESQEVPRNLPGGILLDQSYVVTPSDLNSLLFSPDSNFMRTLAGMKGNIEWKEEPWRLESDGKRLRRVITYIKAPTKLTKAMKATEEHTYLKADGRVFAVLASVSTPDATYGSAFRTEMLYCITPGPELTSREQSSRMIISWRINFLRSTLMKGMIERGAGQALEKSFQQFADFLSQNVSLVDLSKNVQGLDLPSLPSTPRMPNNSTGLTLLGLPSTPKTEMFEGNAYENKFEDQSSTYNFDKAMKTMESKSQIFHGNAHERKFEEHSSNYEFDESMKTTESKNKIFVGNAYESKSEDQTFNCNIDEAMAMTESKTKIFDGNAYESTFKEPSFNKFFDEGMKTTESKTEILDGNAYDSMFEEPSYIRNSNEAMKTTESKAEILGGNAYESHFEEPSFNHNIHEAMKTMESKAEILDENAYESKFEYQSFNFNYDEAIRVMEPNNSKSGDQASNSSFHEAMKKLESIDTGAKVPPNLPGGILLDQSFMVSPSDLNFLLFSPDSKFMRSLADMKGNTEWQQGSWRFESDGQILRRVVTYIKAATKLTKAVKATEEQTYLKVDGKVFAVLFSVSTPDVMYGSTFRTEILYCITPGPQLASGEQSSRVIISWRMNFLQRTMMKGMIERGADQALKSNFQQFADVLSQNVKMVDLSQSVNGFTVPSLPSPPKPKTIAGGLALPDVPSTPKMPIALPDLPSTPKMPLALQGLLSRPKTLLALPNLPSRPKTPLAMPDSPSTPKMPLALPGLPSTPETTLPLLNLPLTPKEPLALPDLPSTPKTLTNSRGIALQGLPSTPKAEIFDENNHKSKFKDHSYECKFDELINTMASQDLGSEVLRNLPGGVLLDQSYPVSSPDLNFLLFSPDSKFMKSLADMKGNTEWKQEDWRLESGGKVLKRVVTYMKAATKLTKAVKATEEQTYLKADGKVFAVLFSVSTPDVMYGNSFKVEILYCITPGPQLASAAQSSRITISWRMNFLQSILMKAVIERGAGKALKISFEQFAVFLSQKVEQFDPSQNVKQANLFQNVKPVELPRNVKLVDSSQNVKPVDWSLNVKPVDLPQNVKLVDSSQNGKPVGWSENVKPVDLSQNGNPVDFSQNVKPLNVSQSVKTVDSSQNVQVVDFSKIAKVVDLSQNVKPVDLSQNVKPVDSKDFSSHKEQVLASLQVDRQSGWKLMTQHMLNFTVVSTAFMTLYVLVHILLAMPSTVQGLEFGGIDLPDSIGEIIVCTILVLQGKRALEKIARSMQASVQRAGDHGVKAQGDGWLLTIALIEGSSLAAVDSTVFSDPYVVFTCNGKTKTSSIKFQKLDPKWNEIFEFDAMDEPPSVLNVEVFDFEGPFSEATSLGHFEIDLVKSDVTALADVWIPLQGNLAQACQSKLNLRIFLNNTKGSDAVKEYLTKVEKEVGKKINVRSPQTNTAFQKTFGLPPAEFLINDFTCQLKRRMLLQGRMFLSPRIIGFHASLFGSKTTFFFLWEDIEDIQMRPSTLASMGSPSIIIILHRGRGLEAKHGAKTQDEDGRLKFHFHFLVSVNGAYRTIMALWKARSLSPEQKMQIVEEESEEKDLQTEESASFSIIEDANMSEVLSSILPIPMSFFMELFSGGDLDHKVMANLGCLDYSHGSWELVNPDVYQRQIRYKFDKQVPRYKGEVASIQQRSPFSDRKGFVIEEVMTLHGFPLGDYYTLHVRYQVEDLSSRSHAFNLQVFFGITWLKSTRNQKKLTKNIVSNVIVRLKSMLSQVEKEYIVGRVNDLK